MVSPSGIPQAPHALWFRAKFLPPVEKPGGISIAVSLVASELPPSRTMESVEGGVHAM